MLASFTPAESTARAVAMAMHARALKAVGQDAEAATLIEEAASMALALEPATASHAAAILKVKAEILAPAPASTK